jgi:hypothetical protein
VRRNNTGCTDDYHQGIAGSEYPVKGPYDALYGFFLDNDKDKAKDNMDDKDDKQCRAS